MGCMVIGLNFIRALSKGLSDRASALPDSMHHVSMDTVCFINDVVVVDNNVPAFYGCGPGCLFAGFHTLR